MATSDTRAATGVERRANRLYWESDRSVNEIADDLDLSKGRLYELLRPLAAERSCPRCGGDLLFANRTARDQKLLSCGSCGLSGKEGELEEEWKGEWEEEDGDGLWVGSASAPAGSGAHDRGQPTPWRARASSGRGRIALGGILIGVAAGAVLVGYLRRS